MKRHNWRLLQQEWLEGGHQTLLEFAAAVKVPASTVEKYAAKHRWKQKGKEAAILIEEQAEQKFIESVSDRIAKARQKHVKIGEILQDKGLRSLAKAENLDAGQAITAIRAGVDIERKGLGIDEAPGGTTNIQNNNFITEVQQLVINDPGARALLEQRIRERLRA